EYHFPFGWKELEGIANRGDFDLSSHSKFSGKELAVHDQETNNSYIPHVVETSVGTDRLFLTVLFDAYHEDIVEGEERVVLKLSPLLAPIKAAFLPLTKKISEPMEKIYHDIEQRGYEVTFDVSGSIGKRYRRQDEIGTPLCFTYDFDSETTNTVTVRMRDTTQQERITIDQIPTYLSNILKS
ncbi:MAG: His/Gly/Thr/Pro-type tRNA ligase C-terminal domain-containing protein, partial [Candidatus Babeliales bacterium]